MLKISNVRLHAEQESGFAHEFTAGAINVVLGANRSGKTDLCRLIAGLPTVATGQVCLDGVDVSDLRTRERDVSLVFQAFVNYPNLTVAQNIASPLRARGERRDLIRERVAGIAAALRIETLLDRLPGELSGGQQQRLAIARALAKQARVLLLDEPLVNLDFKLREALEGELRALLGGSGTTVVYTSSDPRDAFTLGDEVLLLHRGDKLQCGTPLAVYQSPVSVLAMDMLSDPGVNRFAGGAVRPEHVRPARDVPGGRRFSMRVTANETNGDESFVHGEVEGHDWVMRCRGMIEVAAGQDLVVEASAADLVMFD